MKHRSTGKAVAALAACLGAAITWACAAPALADGYKDCTKEPREKWSKTQADAEAAAKKDGYEVRRSKIEGKCYEVYGVKGGQLFELFYSPMDLALKHTIKK